MSSQFPRPPKIVVLTGPGEVLVVTRNIDDPGGGEPARSFLAEAKRARTIEFAREPTPASPDFVRGLHGPLAGTRTF